MFANCRSQSAPAPEVGPFSQTTAPSSALQFSPQEKQSLLAKKDEVSICH